MLNTLLVASADAHSGKSMISIGLISKLLGAGKRPAYFKPVISAGAQDEAHITAISTYFNLSLRREDMYACARSVALHQIGTDEEGELLDVIINKFKCLDERFDFTVVEGTDFDGQGTAFEFELNVLIAKNLAAPVLLVVSAEGRTIDEVMEATLTTVQNFWARHVEVTGVVANKVHGDDVEPLRDALRKLVPADLLLAVVPLVNELQRPSMLEINNHLHGEVIAGRDGLLNRPDHYIAGVTAVKDFMALLQKNTLVITPGDRDDLLQALIANHSSINSLISGLILTDGYIPANSTLEHLAGMQIAPVIAVAANTVEALNDVKAISSTYISGNKTGMALVIETFNTWVDAAALDKCMATAQYAELTPHLFQYKLSQWAKAVKRHIVLPEGDDVRVLEAVARLVEQDIAGITLFGERTGLGEIIKKANIRLDLNRVTIVDPLNDSRFNDYADTLYQLRSARGLTAAGARELMRDASYFGTMMVYKGDADGMVSGAVYTTRQTIRPALQFIKGKPGVSLISSLFFMCLEDRVVVFADCSVNPDPTAGELAEIAISSAETSRRFGIAPLVAMLSYSSGQSGQGKDVEKVRQAVALVKARHPDLKIDGPMQFDAAVSPDVGRSKMPGSEVAGQATVFIFPDLDTGNNLYKAVEREAGAIAIGPILQGLNKPVNDLSRGSTVDDIFNTVLITAIQCQG